MKKQYRESRHVYRKKQNQQAYAATNSSEFKEATWNNTAESSDSFDKRERGFGKSVPDSFTNLVYAHQPSKGSIPIEVSLVFAGWLRNARHLVVTQRHAVQVACGCSWILRRTSSAVHTVNRCCGCCRCVLTVHCFPYFSILPFISSVSSGLRN